MNGPAKAGAARAALTILNDAVVFTSPAGTPMRHNNFYRRFWLPAVHKEGMEGTTSTTYATQATQ